MADPYTVASIMILLLAAFTIGAIGSFLLYLLLKKARGIWAKLRK